MTCYRKNIEEGAFEDRFYKALGFPPKWEQEDIPLVIRITLGDMDLLDGFYMPLPAKASNLSIEDAIRKYIICESEEEKTALRRRLATEPNPDLLEIYDELVYIFQKDEDNEAILTYHINNGASGIQKTDYISMHQQICHTNSSPNDSYNLLDLVLEINISFDPFSSLEDNQKYEMLQDYRRVFILYLMDKFDYQPEIASENEGTSNIGFIMDYLVSEDIGLAQFDNEYSITPKGYALLNKVITEAEFCVDNYDLYGDVYIKGDDIIQFNTGHGLNMIVPIFLGEGIDPYRALFVTALYLGNLDYLKSNLDMLFTQEPFIDVFRLLENPLTVEIVGEEILERVMKKGKMKVEEMQLQDARAKRLENIKQQLENDQI